MMRGNREMRRMLDKMGLDMKTMDNVEEVIIKTETKELISSNCTGNRNEGQGQHYFSSHCIRH